MHKPAWRAHLIKRLLPAYALAAATGAVMLAGFVSLIELLYNHDGSATGNLVSVFGLQVDAGSTATWIVATVVFLVGIVLLRWAWKYLRRAWDEITPQLQAKGLV